ncbi:hypothetical protein OG21DRAFT_1450846 [Imleria badia]|nr:hypothetical protein OG21DRAFT_1450846 [Imleria badia]
MSVNRCLGCASYKQFVLFFMCTLARDGNNTNLSSSLLHLMSSQILRRLHKVGFTPDWLAEMALKTCAGVQEILDARGEPLNAHQSPFQNPSQDELKRDTQLSLLDSCEYIYKALACPGHESVDTPFHPSHHLRGTLEDFLSSNGSFFDEAYKADPDVTLYDVEWLVEQGIDNWITCVTSVDEACIQLEILMNKYMSQTGSLSGWHSNPEDYSIKLLTAIELYVALDKLVVMEIPMLADYPPEISVACLERLLLRKTTSLHRLSYAYQYLSARHSHSRSGWSVLSHEFTKDSFPVRYYDQSPHLQQLKVRIEEDAMKNAAARAAGPTVTHHEYQQRLLGRQLVESAEVSQSPLPALPLHAKVIVFELQCPACVRIWRSAAARILHQDYDFNLTGGWSQLDRKDGYDLLADDPALEPYFVRRGLQDPIHLAYFYPDSKGFQSRNGPTLRYAVRDVDTKDEYKPETYLRSWHPEGGCYTWLLRNLKHDFGDLFQSNSNHSLSKYVTDTCHTSNEVLSAQALCPADLSLDEFIAFGHLRSGGSLQWLNILQGLRSRTVNLRRRQVHFLLVYAAFQVGPFDLNTGTWIWHQELQESSFCNALLDELDSLFMDVGARSMDGMLMRNVSLLLTRVLASSPSEGVTDRAIALLRSVRRKTFSWVQDLSYDLAQAPTNEERCKLLVDMAVTCRSTFGVDPATHHKLFKSAEDVDALHSCTSFIHSLCSKYHADRERYSQLLLERDNRLSLSLKETLRDVILADVSDYGVDLAVGKVFTCYQPGTQRWERLEYPNDRWLTCETEATVEQSSQTVHVNLLNGELRVAGQPLGGLPREIRDSPELQRIFRDQGFFVIPSSLPGMDFTTLAMASKHKVHFSLREDNVVVRAQGNQTKEILQLIPSRKLRGDLPPALVDGHVHWLNLSTKVIEIRPLNRLWEQSSDHWRIDCASGQYRMYKGCDTLVDIRSSTWAMVSEYFKCVNIIDTGFVRYSSLYDKDRLRRQTGNLLITTFPIDSAFVPRLCVTLSRYSLSFFVNEREELESRDFKDMVYDEDQCIGTLLGLENLLVLRPKTHIAGTLLPEALILRRVLIPNGVAIEDGDHQVRTRLYSPVVKCNGPLYHTYDVDAELGCLIGNGSLMSTQYLAHMHAITSCDRPDPLTGKTGAQAALCLLQSGGCRSIMRLKALYLHLEIEWIKTKCPQIETAYREIEKRYYWHPGWQYRDGVSCQRRSYITAPTSSKDRNYGESNYSTTRISALAEPITLDQLLCNRPVPELPARSILPRDSHNTSPGYIPALDQPLSSLRMDASFQREYLTHLDASTQQVRMESQMTHKVAGKNRIEELEKHYVHCRFNYMHAVDILKKSLGPTSDPREQALDQYGQWPPITADVLLRYLASTSRVDIPPRWKKCLISLSLLLLELQRSRRLLRFALDGLEEEFSKELENEGCDGWNPEEYPDWLLIQVQGNFLIRRTQAETAMELMSPQSGQNTVMQVNMGEGKSSVIIPIAAAALADGKQLVRVIVPKALMVQMFELLVARLGGLANRPVYHLPFSRTQNENRSRFMMDSEIDVLHKLMPQCMAERGILLVQPEHVVSLKLMSVEKQICKAKLLTDHLTKHQKMNYKDVTTTFLLRSLPDGMARWLSESPNEPRTKDIARDDKHSGDDHGASKWMSLQNWINSHARDILDESDDILHSRFQMIYTIGLQQHMDGYPDRWTITQQVLRLVKDRVRAISRDHPNFVEHAYGPGSFPRIHVLRASGIGQRLISLIVKDVMAGRLPNFDFQHVSSPLHDAIRSFISDENVLQVPDTVTRVEEYAKRSDKSYLWSGLLLLRGLLASNILLFALAERRWRVDYGLVSQPRHKRPSDHHYPTPTVTMLAVPYRAKDVPAPKTQFGHPDITIILTCLSYYYAGLSEEQLRVSFEILLDQDDPSTEYAPWIKEYDGASVLDSLRNLSDINLRSSEQWDKVIFPIFSRNQAAIDFYLSRVVFPKEAKEFPWKLAGSSWDLGEKRDKLITGFSGTNDGRWLLPMSVTQHDLDHQQGTNAKILAYLLRPENNFYIVTHENGERWTALQFLRLVSTQQPGIRILLDVGAQILDFSNSQVAKSWLDITRDTAGAIYFNKDDELTVLTRNGITQPMLSSPLSQQLDRCVVYLDHAHTRGTDVKLPIGSRAAVTLGPKMTKDALVQGCMRMRKLGCGHSVMFFAPLAVDQSIRAVAGKNDLNIPVTTVDILCWAIHETWTDIQQRAPYWAQQGMNHTSRYDAWSRFCNNDLTPEHLSHAWIQPELKSLTDLYAPRESKNSQSDLSTLDPGIRQRCKDLGVLSLPTAQMEEEQEREVNREQEREREVELPPWASSAKHHLHPDLVAFVKTGIIPPLHSGSAFLPVFTTLEESSASTHESDVWSPSILATADFCRTIKPESTRGTIDQYLRPVQWILSTKRDHNQVLVLLSPFEADQLMPDIRVTNYVHLHVYAARTSQRMKPSDDLRLYSIPPLPSYWTPPWALIDQLNVFAGQLYLRDYTSYLRLCRFLDVPTKELLNDTAIRRNLFNIPGSFEEVEITFSGSPLPSVMALLTIRSRGRPFAHTHMGNILQGQFLTEKDFQR